ncbi:hypothetical protein G7Y89_g14608 [Cudoniella acicularis]|uniref:Aminotransferase class I/classII large domain-containing protein n=1 Tax=Cudoniella acicularis TaxID=354080 RepID=A0A8H4R1Q4_9HELO|nr:hypothetical protein G7Y89_g14608 [Cudoniella acicularis]
MPTPINLQLGWPSPRLFPREELALSTASSLSNLETVKQGLLYGPSLGHAPLRKSIASWLSSFYLPKSGPIPIERISISGGASQNLANILDVFSDPHITQRIWMVEPTYFLACTIFEDAGFSGKMRGVPENENGIDVKFLREELKAFTRQQEMHNGVLPPVKPPGSYDKIFKHILYLTPTFSNPSAKTMPTSVREEVLALAREFDILVVSDDVYEWLRWPADKSAPVDSKLAPIPPRLVDLDRATLGEDPWGNSISNGSFSKIIGPGVRVGWTEASTKMISRLSLNGATQSGGAPSQLTSTFIDPLLRTGALQKHIEEILIPTYRSRFHVLMSAIQNHLEPLGVKVTTGAPYTVAGKDEVLPAGGFFTYISFPESLPSADVIAKKAMEDYALKIAYGEMFVIRGDKSSLERSKSTFGRGARLCWAWHEEEEIEDGVRRLGELVKAMLTEATNS